MAGVGLMGDGWVGRLVIEGGWMEVSRWVSRYRCP